MSKITKFQIAIPKRVREGFNFEDRDVLVFTEEDNKLVLAKSKEYQLVQQF